MSVCLSVCLSVHALLGTVSTGCGVTVCTCVLCVRVRACVVSSVGDFLSHAQECPGRCPASSAICRHCLYQALPAWRPSLFHSQILCRDQGVLCVSVQSFGIHLLPKSPHSPANQLVQPVAVVRSHFGFRPSSDTLLTPACPKNAGPWPRPP